MQNLFIGIDFSKKKFDVTVMYRGKEEKAYSTFSNDTEGYSMMIDWVKSQAGDEPQENWLFCGENTGLYSFQLSEYLSGHGYFMWLEHAYTIKLNCGIQRRKSDKGDSSNIAEYAMRYADKARRYYCKSKTILGLELLFSRRELLIKMKRQMLVHATELRSVLKRNTFAAYDYRHCMSDINRFNKEIKDVEERMKKEVREDTEIRENYELITSIKGISLVNATAFIIHTNNFHKFATARYLACYCGVAPFGKDSGSSVHVKPHVSRFANKTLKSLLTQAARCAVIHDSRLRGYYLRMLEKGKADKLVINNVRNKLVHCMMAVVRTRMAYDPDYLDHKVVSNNC